MLNDALSIYFADAPLCSSAAQDRKFADSSVEGTGFELPVPPFAEWLLVI